MIRGPLACALLGLIAALGMESRPAAASDLAPPGGPAWQSLHFPLVSEHTAYEREADGVRAVSQCSASGLILRLDEPVALGTNPRLRWRWRLDRAPTSQVSEQEKPGDDFGARVYVFFDFDPAQSTLWERMQRRVAATIYGDALPGKAIAYLWARESKLGADWQSPYSTDTHNLVLQSGGAGAWRTEIVDLRIDHERFHGPADMPLMGVALMTDSDDGCSSAEAVYADFELLIDP